MGLFDKIKKSLFGEDEEKNTAEEKKQTEKGGSKEGQDRDQTQLDKETKNDSKLSDDSAQEEKDATATAKSEDSESESSSSESLSDNDLDIKEATNETELYEKGLEKTNQGFGARLNRFFAQFRTVDEDFFDDLEELLIESDVGYETAEELTDELRDEAKLQKAKSRDDLKKVIVEKLVNLYDENGNSENEKLKVHNDGKPNIYLFVGVNGAGKTTTIGKLAKRFKDQGKSVLLAAADTFRAGAVEQLEQWGEKVGVPVVTGQQQADPASVVYDATD